MFGTQSSTESNMPASLTQAPSNTSLFSSVTTSGKNTTIILPGGKKAKTIGRKTEIKADVVSISFFFYKLKLTFKLKSQQK